MVNFNLVLLLSLPFALTSAFAPTPAQTRTLVGHTPSFGFVCKAPKKDTALFAGDEMVTAGEDLNDDQIKSLIADTLLKEEITDVDADVILKSIEGAEKSALSSIESFSSIETQGLLSPCESASIEFAIDAVALGMQAAGMPGGVSKNVGKAIVRRAQKKLVKEMKNIVKDHFGSPNPVNIAIGLIKIFNIIIGDIGFSDILSVVRKSVNFFDYIKIAALLSAYFVTAGGALGVKLALMTPAILDVIQSGIAVGKKC